MIKEPSNGEPKLCAMNEDKTVMTAIVQKNTDINKKTGEKYCSEKYCSSSFVCFDINLLHMYFPDTIVFQIGYYNDLADLSKLAEFCGYKITKSYLTDEDYKALVAFFTSNWEGMGHVHFFLQTNSGKEVIKNTVPLKKK